MKHKFLIGLALIAAACVLLPLPLAAEAYVYSYEGESKPSPALYAPQESRLLRDGTGAVLGSAADICVGPDGGVFVADPEKNRICIFSAQLAPIGEITGFTDPATGAADTFSGPMGCYCDADGVLYVADTGNGRIVVFDRALQATSVIGQPSGSGVPADFIYHPTAVAADKSGRVYAVSDVVTLGVVSFTMDGTFDGFMGAQTVTPTVWERLWRRIMTEKQLGALRQLIPTSYNNITVDDSGFVYVTTSSLDMEKQYAATLSRDTSSDYAPIRRLNPSGDDVLKRNGAFPPSGDIEVDLTAERSAAVSAIADIAIGPNGIYTVTDRNNLHLFTYDADGNLLCAFGGRGKTADTFSSLTAIAYREDELLVLDGTAGRLARFCLTDYGSTVMQAIRLDRERNYSQALALWQDIAKENGNFDVSNIHMGRIYLSMGEYGQAMQAFRLVNDKENYSKAFQNRRDELVRKFFVLIPVVLVAAVLLLVRLSGKIKAVNKATEMSGGPTSFGRRLLYGFYAQYHPADGSYEIKMRGRASVGSATVYLAAALLAFCLFRTGSGYLLSSQSVYEKVDVFGLLLSFAAPFFLFAAASWCVGTFMDGEASFRNIYIMMCYAMLPLILILIPLALISNVLTLDEKQMVVLLQAIAYLWMGLLVFVGMQTIQNYSVGRAVLSLLFTLLAMAIMMFVLLLGITLLQRIVQFIEEAGAELLYRL